MFSCGDCNRDFRSLGALHAHCRDSSDHAYCEPCQRLFVHNAALDQHLQNSPAHLDESESEDEDDDHSDVYDSDDSESDEEEPPYCRICNRWFVDATSLFHHLSENSRHNWCFMCSRDFKSATALNQHLSSSIHKDRDMKCPLCTKTFKTPSGIALHIESGACHNITRHQVTAAVHSMKVVPTVSITRRLHGPTTTPSVVHYSASECAFNGLAYECYLCNRTFRTLVSLNAHLNSPAHDADEFKCPKCKTKFKLISGLIQHIESECCGMARFSQVESHTKDMLAQFSRLLTL